MSIDTLVLPRNADADADASIPTQIHETVAPSGATARPRPAGRGAWALIRAFVSDERDADHLMLLGPSGGPLWTSRLV